jgi:hypothetical protein
VISNGFSVLFIMALQLWSGDGIKPDNTKDLDTELYPAVSPAFIERIAAQR